MTGRGFFSTLANNVVLLSGWRALFLCFALGASSALGLAPLHFFPVLWITFPLLVFCVDGAVPDTQKHGLSRLIPAFWRGYWFGFGYFVAGLWWLGAAFLVDAEVFAWLIPLAVLGLPLLLAFFFAFAISVARIFWSDGARRILALAASLAFFEWLRGTIFTGFPWNSLGSLLAANDFMMQGVALFGLHTYGFFAVLIFASPAVLIDTGSSRRPRLFFACMAALLLTGLVGYGIVRLSTAQTHHVAQTRLRIVQPNIAQEDKFKPEKAVEIFNRYLSMSARSTRPGDLGLLSVTHLIWPESAFPFLLTEEPEALAAIAELLPQGTTLLTGAARADPRPAGGGERTYYNSLYAIGHDGAIKDAYDKVHLVPFGEYLPFEHYLEKLGLLSLVQVPGGFSPGTHRRLLKSPNAPPFLPMICYEAIFPDQISSQYDTQEAGWILNVTNDAWFGMTAGPYQHFHQVRLRAVDEGVPVIRAANNGISAVIDAYGRIEESAPLGEAAIIDANLPESVTLPLDKEYKPRIFWLFLLLSIFIFSRGIWSKYA